MSHNHHHLDASSVHGMLLVGSSAAYLSHLPMFMSPHDYQVLLEVGFAKGGENPQEVYARDRAATGEKVYTFVPKRFVLTDLVSEDPARPRLRSIKGTIFRGHFERGGVPIVDDVTAQIERVLHFRKFDPLAGGLNQLQYLLFGKEQELFLAHYVSKAPDFDQVLSAEISGGELTTEQLAAAVIVAFTGRENSVEGRLTERQSAQGRFLSAGGEGSPEGAQVTVEAGTEFYFETGDLST